MQAEVVKGDSSNMSEIMMTCFQHLQVLLLIVKRTIEFSFSHILPPELYSSMVVQQLHTY
jgi:hypothetical protein